MSHRSWVRAPQGVCFVHFVLLGQFRNTESGTQISLGFGLTLCLPPQYTCRDAKSAFADVRAGAKADATMKIGYRGNTHVG